MDKEIVSKSFNEYIFRSLYYVIGLVLLAIGITLNTKTLWGVSAIISVPYTIAKIFDFNLGNATLAAYVIMVIAQFFIKGKNRSLIDLLQIPLSIVFTRFLNVFDYIFNFPNPSLIEKVILLIAAIVCTGIGAAMTVNMKLIANPGDAIVSAIADRINKGMGFTKNIFDISCVIVSLIIGMIYVQAPVGIGIGTLFSMIGVGRVIAFFNAIFKEKMQIRAGLA